MGHDAYDDAVAARYETKTQRIDAMYKSPAQIIKAASNVYLDVIGSDETFRLPISKSQALRIMKALVGSMTMISLDDGAILITPDE